MAKQLPSMPAAVPPTIFVVKRNGAFGRDFIWKAFATEAAWRAEHAKIVSATSDTKYADRCVYEHALQCHLSEREYKQIVKTGLLWGAAYGTKEKWSIVIAQSRSGLVKKARAVCSRYTDNYMFRQSTAGGLFLLDGYPVPKPYTRLRPSDSHLEMHSVPLRGK